MKRKGISSSLALLASTMILMAQICINLAFMEVMREEIMSRAEEVIKIKDYSRVILIAVNETSLVVVNRRDGDLLINGLSLCYLNGSTADVEVEWRIPKMSMSERHLPLSLKDCIATILRIEGGFEVILPVHRAQL
jgi:hypothetical protein